MNAKISFSGTFLKWTAIITMSVDHLARAFADKGLPVPAYYLMRGIGRLAFPIFCFLLTEGFHYTKSFKKYWFQMLVLALISEIPYNLLNFGTLTGNVHQNILFTFCITLLVLWVISRCRYMGAGGAVISVCTAAAGAYVSYMLGLEYSYKCVLLGCVFYVTSPHIYIPTVSQSVAGKAPCNAVRNNIYVIQSNVLRYTAAAVILIFDSSSIEMPALFALLFVAGYGGSRGRFPKFFAYIYYPLHMLMFVLAGNFIM